MSRGSWLAAALLALIVTGCAGESPPVSPELAPLHQFAEHRITLNGLEFRYLEQGQGELLVLLHGFPYFADVWYKQIAALSPHYRSVAVDNRGYAWSDKPGAVADYRLEYLVADVRALIERLSPSGRAIVVGHDWGGGVAFALAQQYPERVSKLVVINAPPPNALLNTLRDSDAQREASRYMGLLRSRLTPWYLSLRGPGMFWGEGMQRMQADGEIPEAFRLAYLESWRQPGAYAGALKWYRANFPDFDAIRDEHYWPSREARVSVPTLLIWSEQDAAFVQDTLDETLRHLDNVVLKLIPTASHTPFLDRHAPQVNQTILDFLRGSHPD